MSTKVSVELSAITVADLVPIGHFLHDNLNHHVAPEAWVRAVNPAWMSDAPNHGFMLQTRDGKIVGVYLAFYSARQIAGATERFCNLAAWCVLEAHRGHGLRLVRALLAQVGYHFTDLSPSGNVVPLNKRLKFQELDTTTALVPNLPRVGSSRTRITTNPTKIARVLTGNDLTIYRDHAHTPAANHLVVQRGSESCYVIFRRDRRKNLPLFASILYVGNPNLFRTVARNVYGHLLVRHGIPVTLAELRIVGDQPLGSRLLRSARPKMFRSSHLQPDQIDYLYSELTCVAW
ncbi:hypothetical protein [Antricoccus suffuscus]|nr:hypothetical protein [Antricoccus suffuscus]